MSDDYMVIRDAKSLAAQLRATFPDAEDALADTIDGEVDLTNALYRVLMSAEENRVFIAALSTRISELEERRTRIEQAADKKRAIVLNAMMEIGIRKIERPELTASVVPSPPKVVITDEAVIPPLYMRVKTEPAKFAILADLKQGKDIPGATLSNPSSHLTIRRT